VNLAASVDLPMDATNLVMPAADATPAEVDASPVRRRARARTPRLAADPDARHAE
jgi:hypothetical protein